jgi:hypothetical protein
MEQENATNYSTRQDAFGGKKPTTTHQSRYQK